MPNKLGYLLTTGRVMSDKFTGGLFSYIDTFNAVFIPKNLESYIVSFNVAGKIYSDEEGEKKITVVILDPGGNVFQQAGVAGGTFKGDLQFFAAFNLVVFEKIGTYRIKVKINDGEYLKDDDKFYFEVVKSQV